MSQATLDNGARGLVIRNALNSMFGDLYGALPLTPDMFEAVRDGVANDSSNIQDCLDHVSALGGGDVEFLSGTYYTGTTTITIPANVSVQARRGSKILYSGTGVAVDVLGNAASGSRTMVLPRIVRAGGALWDTAVDTTSCGLRVSGCHYDKFFITEIRNFRRGLTLKAVPNAGDNIDSGNCTSNTFYLGQIINNWKGITFEWYAGGGGFIAAGVNQNTFMGGVIRIDSPYTHEAGRDYIYMPDAENNLNTFVGINLEKGGNERAIYCASISNVWLNCRYELASAGYIEFAAGALNNRIIGGHSGAVSAGSFDTIVTNAGFGNVFFWADGLSSKFFKLDFNSGKIYLGGGSAAPSIPINGFSTNRAELGDASTSGWLYHGSMRQVTPTTQTTGTLLTGGPDHHTLTYAAPATITGMANVSTLVEGLVTIVDTVGNITLQYAAAPTSGQGKFWLTGAGDLALTAKKPVLFRIRDGNFYQI